MGRDWRWLACPAAGALTISSPGWAQQQAPDAQQSSDDGEIVVRADRDQVRIDRRVYSLRNDPIAQSTDMFDVLGRIPSVSVDPSGAVSLLGTSNVQIQINGQPLPQGASVEQVLRGLQGADVERIEVITNPSAQYSSGTSGGIINIVTRRRFDRGFSGNANLSADSFGGAQASTAPSWSRGPWALNGRLGYYSSQSDRTLRSEREDLATADLTTNKGSSSNTFQGAGGNAQASYQVSRATRVTLSADSFSGNGDTSQATDWVTNAVPIFLQERNGVFEFDYNRLGFQIQRDGARPREQLRLESELWRNHFSNNATIAVDPVSGPSTAFFVRNAQAIDNAKITLDYDRPFGGDFLTTGFSAERQTQDIGNLQRTLLGPPAPSDFEAAIEGRELTIAAYGTYQFHMGDWTLLPGLRAEDYRRDVESAGGSTRDDDLRFFPTLHVRRSFDHIDLDLSYTSRIDRLDISSLDPTVRFTDANHAMSGNPNLRPSTVDAYEANLTYQQHEQTIALTFFDRLKHDVTSPFVSQVGGVTLYSQVNAGDDEERGLQALFRGTLGPRWRYAFTANALNNAFNRLQGGVFTRDSAFEYFGSASIEYRDQNQNAVGADDVQLEIRFSGPTHTLQQETEASYYANFSWRRRLGDRLFGFLQISDMFASRDFRQLTRTDDFAERSVMESPGARVRLSLTYQFGNITDRPPPPPTENSGGGPR